MSWTSDATCNTCPWYYQFTTEERDALDAVPSWEGYTGLCRIGRPLVMGDSKGVWPAITKAAWCGEHPDRQRRDYAETTLLGRTE